GYYQSSQLSEAQGMSEAMNTWNKSQTTSLTTITKIVTIRTVAVTTFHQKTFVLQRGTVEAVSPWEFVTKSSNGTFEVWHTNMGTKFLNVAGNKTGWNAMTGNTMSSYGSWNAPSAGSWDSMSKSWDMRAKTIARGDVVFVFGQKVNGKLFAQL